MLEDISGTIPAEYIQQLVLRYEAGSYNPAGRYWKIKRRGRSFHKCRNWEGEISEDHKTLTHWVPGTDLQSYSRGERTLGQTPRLKPGDSGACM